MTRTHKPLGTVGGWRCGCRFDGDDTLWHNETLFQSRPRVLRPPVRPYHPPERIQERLFATEMKNLRHFGYGIKGFTLSMIETAIELTEGRVTGAEIKTILGLGPGHAAGAHRAARRGGRDDRRPRRATIA